MGYGVNFQVMSGVDEFLFNLVILGSLVNSDGVVWQSRGSQYYAIECMPLTLQVSLHPFACTCTYFHF